MTTIINSSTSGLTQTVDLSATLQIQTANTTAITIGTDQNITCNSTGALTINSGTTAQRPSASNATNGMIRYNSNTATIECYLNSTWNNLSTSGIP
jgi:hypothetical protein